jgi:DNA-binding NarL/FixJ family response regulator
MTSEWLVDNPRLEFLTRQAEFVQNLRAFRQSMRLYQTARFRMRTAHAVAAPLDPASTPERGLPEPPPAALDEFSVHLLTPRQLEIAALIARGYSNQRIAEVLVLTPGTVANHVQHIFDRLELHSRTQVGVWYTRHTRAL